MNEAEKGDKGSKQGLRKKEEVEKEEIKCMAMNM